MNLTAEPRRPIKTRSSAWAQRAAARLARTNVSPNQVSVASVGCAALGAWWLVGVRSPIGLSGCALMIQGRLLCNLFDGMLAVEGGKGTAVGPLYNELPDRIADSLLIVALGYAVDLPALGWLGALAAALTACVRLLGGALGLAQDFRGPLAKQQRMAVMTLACVIGAVEQAFAPTAYALTAAAYAIAVGSLATCATRSRALAHALRAQRS